MSQFALLASVFVLIASVRIFGIVVAGFVLYVTRVLAIGAAFLSWKLASGAVAVAARRFGSAFPVSCLVSALQSLSGAPSPISIETVSTEAG